MCELYAPLSRGEKNAETEIEVYLKLSACSKDEKVLDWWKAHAESLPRLSEFAKQILAIPASPSSSERLFSLAALFDTVKRGMLRLETLEVLTLLKANKQLMEDHRIDIDNEETAATDSSASEESFDEESGESEREGTFLIWKVMQMRSCEGDGEFVCKFVCTGHGPVCGEALRLLRWGTANYAIFGP